jgi:hypothetical protein
MDREKEYNLIYVCKETGREFRVKRITKNDYKILDLSTGEATAISSSRLRKFYIADKGNAKRQRRAFQALDDALFGKRI